jgi:hypothetical protein
MILLDTGYFIALFTPDDHLHQRAVAWSLHLNEPLLGHLHLLRTHGPTEHPARFGLRSPFRAGRF